MSPRTADEQRAITPKDGVALLRAGNARFVRGDTSHEDLPGEVRLTAGGQHPFAAVLSCLDSRIPAEVVFDQGIGDLFVARVAGNFVNDDILGSLEFATKLAGARLIVIMGHTSCGAVKGACDRIQLGLFTGSLANIAPAVAAVAGHYEPADSANAEFVDAVSERNVRHAIEQLRERSDVLRDLLNAGEIGLVGAMYDVINGEVTFLDR
jgi:carbonic anhydrase